MSEIKELPVQNIITDPKQPRKTFDEIGLSQLAESIKEVGLLQPILVRPIENGKFQFVHGERRWRAHKLIGLKTIKAEVRKLSDKEVLEIQLVENLQREDLNPIEEAETFQRMMSKLHYTQKAIAKRIGKSREYVAKRLRLLNLPLITQNKIKEGKLTFSHGEALLSVKNPVKQEKIAEKIIENQLSVRQTKDLAGIKADPMKSVLHRTSEFPEDGQVIGIWVSEQILDPLSDRANSEKTTVEKLCSKIIERGVKEWKR